MSATALDAEIELEAIVADVRAGRLPIATVVDELAWELCGDDARRVEVLRRALEQLGGGA